MKDLRIPIPSEQSVDLSAINPDFKGIIIGYKGSQAIGYIQYSDGTWYFMAYIDVEGSIEDDEILLDLISSLLKRGICDHFKVLEFVRY